jgi:hypothetical protein
VFLPDMMSIENTPQLCRAVDLVVFYTRIKGKKKNMRKIFLILLFFIYWTFLPFHLLHSKTIIGNEKSNNLKYRFEYMFQGKTTGVILFFFRYRMFIYTTASVLLSAEKTDEKSFRFNFVDIDKTGYLIRTWGFSGKALFTGAADYDVQKAQEILEKDFLIFKEKATDFSRIIKRRKVFPYRILSRGENVITFTRDNTGIHRDCSLDMQMQSIKNEKEYDFWFQIYPVLLEMLKIYNHPFFSGDWQEISQLEPDREWHSPVLDYSENINRIGERTTDVVGKLVKFKQRRPFQLTYRVVSRIPGLLTIHGEAEPHVKIWDGYKITQVTRTIELRLPDGVVLKDQFHVEIRNKKGRGGYAHCALTLVQ